MLPIEYRFGGRHDPGWYKQDAAGQMTESMSHPILQNRLWDEDQMPIHETGIPQLLSIILFIPSAN